MYSSLDRIDVVAEDDDGRPLYLQTDHRAADEIEAQPELSVLFALTRVMMPARAHVEGPRPRILYVAASMPPALLAEAVAAGGAELHLDSGQIDGAPPPYEGTRRSPEDLAEEAFRGLAERIRVGRGAAVIDDAMLIALEDEILAARPDPEGDELGFWTRVLEVVAIAGELVRSSSGGRWALDVKDLSSLPFAFESPAGTFNLAGKAERFLRRGEGQRASLLVSAARDLGDPDAVGVRLFTLKPQAWEAEGLVARPLLESAPESPLVVVCDDFPNRIAMSKLTADVVPDAMFDEALANLRDIEVDVEHVEVDGAILLAVTGSFYAAEKLLDEDWMRALHTRLSSAVLAAAVPHKGLLMVTVPGPATGHAFVPLVEARFEDPGEHEAISPMVFLVGEGRIMGLWQPEAEAAQPQEPRFWRWLFGGKPPPANQ